MVMRGHAPVRLRSFLLVILLILPGCLQESSDEVSEGDDSEVSIEVWYTFAAETIEEDLEMLAKAMEMGIDPFPPPKPKRPWARYAIASFLSIMMISWVSKFLMRFT